MSVRRRQSVITVPNSLRSFHQLEANSKRNKPNRSHVVVEVLRSTMTMKYGTHTRPNRHLPKRHNDELRVESRVERISTVSLSERYKNGEVVHLTTANTESPSEYYPYHPYKWRPNRTLNPSGNTYILGSSVKRIPTTGNGRIPSVWDGTWTPTWTQSLEGWRKDHLRLKRNIVVS